MYTRIFLISACLRAFAYSYDVCDFSHIYNPSQFEYILPEKILKTYYDGNSFDRPTLFYSSEEKERLNEDIRSIFKKVIQSATEQNQNPPPCRIYCRRTWGWKNLVDEIRLKKTSFFRKNIPVQ